MTKSSAERDVARETLFFGSLPEPVFDAIYSSSRIVELEASEALFLQHDPADAVFAVVQGMVKLTAEQMNGHEVVVETFTSGSSFAEALAFGNELYPVSAIALVPSRILVAPSKSVQAAITNHPEAFGDILAAAFAHLHRLVRQIEMLKSNSGTQRLAKFILAQIGDSDETSEIQIPYEKQVLASLLGVQPETLSRAFRRLGDHGISLEGRVIRLEDANALRKFLDDN